MSMAVAAIWPGPTWPGRAGGNVFMLRYALHRSGGDTVFRDLLAQDALVYGGYSTGPSVLSPTLRGLEVVDDADAVARIDGSEPVSDGLPLLGEAFVPHYHRDRRHRTQRSGDGTGPCRKAPELCAHRRTDRPPAARTGTRRAAASQARTGPTPCRSISASSLAEDLTGGTRGNELEETS